MGRISSRRISPTGVRVGLAAALTTFGLGAVTAPPAAAAETLLYVAQGGVNTGTCASQATPCATVNYALTQAATGATIKVSGTIFGRTEITKAITITGEGAASPAVLDGSNTSNVIYTHAGGLVTLDHLTITHGFAANKTGSPAYGGGIMSTVGSVRLTNSTVTANKATLQGGGIWHRGSGTLTVVDSTVSNNSAANCGGCLSSGGGGINVDGISGGGHLTVVDSTVSGNKAAMGGGGIEADGGATLTLVRSTVSGNQGTRGGGVNGGNMTITKSTITGNSATYGGGTWNIAGVVLNLNESTIARNNAFHSGGGITNQLGTVRFRGSIVAKNTVDGVTPDNCATHGVGTFVWTSYGYNLADMDQAGCGLTQPTDVIGDPLLGSLAANGGPTTTMMPGVGSPARNKVPAGVVLNSVTLCQGEDQRGYLRPQTGSSTCAIGAVEPGSVQAVPASFTSASQTSVASGLPLNFTVTTTALPVAKLSLAAGSALPPGITFTDNGNGTASLKGISTLVGTHTFTLKAANSVDPEASQTFTLTVLPGATSYFSVNDVRINERNPGSSASATFTVTRSGNISGASTVTVASASGSAVAPADYTQIQSTVLSFGPSETSKTVSSALTADTVPETDETFTLALTAPTNGVVADAQGVATIANDDAASYVNVGDAMAAEGNAGTTALTFKLTRSGSLTAPASVSVTTANSTAVAGSDFTALPPTTVSWLASEATRTVTISLIGDTVGEPNETFRLNLSSPVGVVLGDSVGWATIVDDEPRTFVTVSDAVVTEGNSGGSAATFILTRTGSLSGASSVTVATANGTGLAGSDYVALPPTTVSWLAGQETKGVSINVTGDTVAEDNESFRLNLSAATGATLADSIGWATIVDNEGPVTNGPKTFLTVSDTSVVEGAAATTAQATFTLTRTGNLAGTTTVGVASSDGSAVAGSDYTAKGATTVTFGANEPTKTVTVTVTGDAVRESDETFNLDLSGVSGATITDARGTARVVNDDITWIWVSDASFKESGPGSQPAMTFTLTRGGNLGLASSVKVQTTDSTAKAGSDYVAHPLTTISFAAGQATASVAVMLIGDSVGETNEAFALSLSGVTGAGLADAAGSGTIINDDLMTWLSVDDVSLSEGDSGTAVATFTVIRSGSLAPTTSVTVGTAGSTATAGSDFVTLPPTVLSFGPNVTTRTVSVTVSPDLLNEVDESFLLNLSAAVNGHVIDSSGAAVIVDDD